MSNSNKNEVLTDELVRQATIRSGLEKKISRDIKRFESALVIGEGSLDQRIIEDAARANENLILQEAFNEALASLMSKLSGDLHDQDDAPESV